jgi:hypothetical protein
LIEGSASSIFFGYLLGGSLMLVGALVELLMGVKAERQSLESIAMPLSANTMSDEPAPIEQKELAQRPQ